jgi:hypothetical protein
VESRGTASDGEGVPDAQKGTELTLECIHLALRIHAVVPVERTAAAYPQNSRFLFMVHTMYARKLLRKRVASYWLKLEIIRHSNDTFLRLLRGTFAIAFCPIKSLLDLRNKTSQALMAK